MRGPHNLFRLIRTGATFERTGAMKIALVAVDAPRNIRIAARIIGWPFKWLGLKGDPSQPPVLRAITALGPAFVKFGQLLSTRPDVVGEDLAQQLTILQDNLPAFPTRDAKRTIETELGIKISELFSEFSDPVAAASIAQVHKAKIRETDEAVAVKVCRPGIERAFRRDIDALYFLARMIGVLSPATRRLRPRAVVAHFEGVVMRELDLRMEASAADEFAAATKDDEGFGVPRVHWHLSSKRVLTLDWVEGIGLRDIQELDAAGHDRRDIAVRIVQNFLRQALRDGYFHADLHQGNFFVAANGEIIAMDFGIMGRIDAYTRRVYAEILIGFIKRDYRRVAEVHFEAGYVPADQDVDDFAQALRSIGEPIFGMEASQISMSRLLAHLFEVTERYGMRTRTELILLQRTMVVAEGVARSLDPNLIMWNVAKPVVEQYIRENLGPGAAYRDIAAVARMAARLGPRIPKILEGIVAERLEQESSAHASWQAISPLAAFLLGAVLAGLAAAALQLF
ncbi:MAG: 2-polyprenylphenol 6-hydroxylase [Albidovulum sp.]|nr:2-polyprenylphenol 6-hydroxylase [Albidovulum sp.]MDE0532242.1 2-polyprenylphenol 6-hydroxylase [Albidovulum sp.]